MKVVTSAEMQEIERATIDENGIPGEVLMYLAGHSVSRFVLEHYSRIDSVAVFAGSGNNGGDGFVTAHFLNNKNIKVKIYTTGKPGSFSKSTEIYYNLCVKTGIEIIYLKPGDVDKIFLDESSLIIDSLTGTGFSGAPRGILAELLKFLNSSGLKIVSVDIPSGLPSDGEAPEGDAVIADHTITIGLPKISLVTYPGKKFAGMVEVADIGFPVSLTGSDAIKRELVNIQFLKRSIPEFQGPDTHKGENGHLLLLGGFDGMEGAIMMAAMSALETGVGLITLITTAKARNIIAGKIPELMTRTIDEAGGEESLKDLMNEKRYDVMVIGPGMGRGESSSYEFLNVMNIIPGSGIKKVLVDGDGLFHLSSFIENNRLPEGIEFIITPHFKEASRLLRTDIEEIKRNRAAAAMKLSVKTGAVTILKGPASIISDGTRTYINTSGNPSLATGGTGDILSGITGAFMLRMDTLAAACMGTYIHGAAADLYCSENETGVIKATDIIRLIRKVVACLS